jgi:hypothetical protein
MERRHAGPLWMAGSTQVGQGGGEELKAGNNGEWGKIEDACVALDGWVLAGRGGDTQGMRRRLV